MKAVHYESGERVHVGDIVDVEHGRGTIATVVVIIPTGEAAAGFRAAEWAYLRSGIILQDSAVFGLLHLPELNHEHVLLQRAQQGIQRDGP